MERKLLFSLLAVKLSCLITNATVVWADDLPTLESCIQALFQFNDQNRLVSMHCEMPDASIFFGKDQFKLASDVQCKNLTATSLCESIDSACQQKYGRSPMSADSCSTRDSRVLEQRAGISTIIKNRANSFVQSLVSDREFQTKCCGASETCLSCFKGTTFKVEGNIGAFCRTYRRDPPHIECTEGGMTEYFNENGVERILLHELGHACQNCRHSGSSHFQDSEKNGTVIFSCNDPADISLAKRDIQSVTDWRIAQCVIDELLTEYFSRKHGKVCFRDWLREAFADVVFYERKKDLAHWSRNCGAMVDSSHGPQIPIIGCLLRHGRLKSMLCGSSH